jgi:hypothetical protein
MPADAATSQVFAKLATELSAHAGVTVGAGAKRSFGSGALKVNGKIFAMVSSQGHFVAKLPAQRVASLVASGSGTQFDPGHGRLMKEWLEVHQVHLPTWRSLALEALSFVRG